MNKTLSFEEKKLGPYTAEEVCIDWNNPSRIMGANDGRSEIVEDPLGSSLHILQVKYPKGKVGQEKDGGGAQWRFKFDKPYLSFTVEYQVMFPFGLDFVKGGKLPGLSGGTSPGGGKKSDGSDGFSARIMWREQGELFQYMYWMERAPEKRWGDNFSWIDINGDQKPFKIIPGQWHILKTQITMNTPGEKDGEIVSWFDGKVALSRRGAFRAKGATFGVDNFNFTTFFGGNTPDWAPSKDEVIYFKNFKFTGGKSE